MRDLLGGLFAIAVFCAVGLYIVDLSAMKVRPVTKEEVAGIMLVMAISMLCFMFITNRGFAKEPRPNRYDH